MKRNHSDDVPEFVEFNDDNLEHVMAGPDYGQPWSSSYGWTELESLEFPSFVDEIAQKILTNHPRLGQNF